jgi:hypothetical protein
MNWKAIVGIVVVLLLVVTAAGMVRDSRMESDFPSLPAKSSEAEVRRILGTPKEIQRPCDAYGTSVTPDCSYVFVYRSIFYPVRSKYWLVFFNKNNQVTATSSKQ